MMRRFDDVEYRSRVTRAQSTMQDLELDALFLTTEPDIRYFTGFLTRFWESPTRPWFLILPASGDPIAVIPSIGAHLMRQSWMSDIRTWRAPDYEDDGVSLLADTLREVTSASGRIGTPSEMESYLRMPLSHFERLRADIAPRQIVSDNALLRGLRMVKSPAEITMLRAACDVASRAFERVPEIAHAGVPLDEVFRRFQMLCLEEGADWVSYLAGGAGSGGYGDVISPADNRPLSSGDVLMLDTGVVRDGYFSDFDRNFAVGDPGAEATSGYARLLEASDTAFDLAKPGATASDLFYAMDKVVTGGTGGSDAGRLGHGLGMQLTEWPSLIPSDHTALVPGMVLTLEPGITLPSGATLVHEEVIVITETGAEYLSTPAPRELPRLAT